MKTTLLILAVAVYVAFTLVGTWNLLAPTALRWIDREAALWLLTAAAGAAFFAFIVINKD